MNLSRFVSVGMLGVCLAMAACGGPPTAPTPALASVTAAVATATVLPATEVETRIATPEALRPTATAARQTEEPAPTARPTATAYPPLQTNGPYFTYWKEVDGQLVLVRLDADGRGRSEILVESMHVWPGGAGSLSPTGEWVVGYGGAEWDCYAAAVPETLPDQTLEILSVANGSVQTITPLFGQHFLDEFAAATANVTAAELGDTAIEDVAVAIWQTLACGLHARAWSPNGRYLAFAAALDGGSADLYLYDAETGKITRESAGPEQIVDISWSPEGTWILYSSTKVRAYASLDHIHAVAVDGHARLSNVDAGLLSRVVWVGPEVFLNYSAGDTDSGYNLRAVDLTDGTARPLCAGGFYGFAVDREMGLVAANCQIGLRPTDLSGLYLFDLTTGRQTKVSDDVARVETWGLGNGRFRVKGLEGGDEILAADGSRMPWPWGDGTAVLAPQRSYLAVVTAQAMQIYSAAGELVRTIELPGGNGPDAVWWRPDDLGLFYRRGAQLYAVDTLTGESRPVDSQLRPDFAEAYGMQWAAR